jgi:transcriptional regulator with XRE-family HTH domain
MVDLSTCEAVMQPKKNHRRWVDREQFYVARHRAGLDVVSAADMLGVNERTIRNWENGTSAIPYAAFRLMRMAAGYQLLGKEWEGWTLWRGLLWTPENRSFAPHELRYIANYLSMARHWIRERQAARAAAADAATSNPPAGLVSPLASAKAGTLPPASRVPPSVAGVRLLRVNSGEVGQAAGLQGKTFIGDNAENTPRFGAIDASLKLAANDDIHEEVL